MRKLKKEKMVVCFAWYRPEQWQRVRDIASDADVLENSYQEWLGLAEEKLVELRSAGVEFKKVDIDSEQLILWCNERGFEVNASARSRYAAERQSQLDRDHS